MKTLHLSKMRSFRNLIRKETRRCSAVLKGGQGASRKKGRKIKKRTLEDLGEAKKIRSSSFVVRTGPGKQTRSARQEKKKG